MYLLIAESKTMRPCGSGVTAADLARHTAAGYGRALGLMESLGAMTATQLSAAIKISGQMALAMQSMIFDFPDSSRGLKADEAFTGVVFRAIDAATLPDDARARLDCQLKIVSSLYGLLRADDIIKPYRLDYTTRVAPGGVALARWQQEATTGQLIAAMERDSVTDLIDLLPGDAAKMLDWKRIAAAGGRRWQVEFKQAGPDGRLRTPASNLLKTLRGQLVRQIATDCIATPGNLADTLGDTVKPSAAGGGVLTIII